MTLKSNALLKLLVPGVIFIAMLVVLRGCGDDGGRDTAGQQQDPTLTLSDEELQALGVEGDTPQDTVATLVGQVQVMRDEVERARAESEALRQEAVRLTERNRSVDEQIDRALRQERARQQSESQRQSQREEGLLGSLQQQLNRLQRQVDDTATQDDMPIGLGLEGGVMPEETGYGALGASGLAWVEPMDGQQVGGRGSAEGAMVFPTAFGEAASSVERAAQGAADAVQSQVTEQPDAATVEPVYTLPESSTLMGSLAMTALIGRVPVDGTVTDPYPFKVVVGADNLTANGVELPEVQAAIMSGTATGDWTLSCVRGDIHTVTFVFQDGTIRTLPSPEELRGGNSSSGGGNGESSRTSIGWISDPYGIPCVSGERSSNAAQVLGTQSLLTAAGAGVATLLSDDGDVVSTFNTDGSVSTAMSGSQAAQQIMASGVNDMSQWVNRLYGEAFAAIFVPPGREVAIHIDRELQIDYETQGRRVRYDQPSLGFNDLP